MKRQDLKKSSETNWAKVDSTTDAQIDYKDNPPLQAEFFRTAHRFPGRKAQVTLRIDRDVLEFFRRRGRGYQTSMNAALRLHAYREGAGHEGAEARKLRLSGSAALRASQAFYRFLTEISCLPYLGVLETIHRILSRLREHHMFSPDEPWLHPAKLAAIAKHALLHGQLLTNHALFDMAPAMNTYNDFWSAVEDLHEFPRGEHAALFFVRLSYQQCPFLIYEQRIPKAMDSTRNLLAEMPDYLDRMLAIPRSSFLRMVERTYHLFRNQPSFPADELRQHQDHADQVYYDKFLGFLSADRSVFLRYQQRLLAIDFRDVPYEFNALLRYPIISYQGDYWSPFPELITYAGTRGLYFSLGDEFGERFRKDFAVGFERYVLHLLRVQFGPENVSTEEDEMAEGWTDKVNDFTVAIGDTLLLIECKLSALYRPAKTTADIESVREDVKKNLRSAVLQLARKHAAVEAGKLPPRLKQFYKNARHVLGIVLLFDQIGNANAAKGLRYLLEKEASQGSPSRLPIQVWHLEEFENLIDLTPPGDVLPTIKEKFENSRFAPWDLNTFLFQEHRLAYLRPNIFVPHQAAKLMQVVEEIKDKD